MKAILNMRVNVRKILYLTIILISITINICFGLIIYQNNNVKSDSIDISYLYHDYDKYHKYIDLIINHINSHNFKSISNKIDFIRNWIYENSVHNIDSSYNLKDAFNTPKVLSMLWETHETKENHISLTCGPRAVAMQNILDIFNLKSRVIMVFTDDYDQVRSHTFLEVFNTDYNKWETHDPDYNIHYIEKNTNNRISTFKLVFGDKNNSIPVSGNTKGWKENHVDRLKEHYFEGLMYGNPITTINPVILINRDKFNLNKSFKLNNNMNFFQFSKKHYRNPVLVDITSYH